VSDAEEVCEAEELRTVVVIRLEGRVEVSVMVAVILGLGNSVIVVEMGPMRVMVVSWACTAAAASTTTRVLSNAIVK